MVAWNRKLTIRLSRCRTQLKKSPTLVVEAGMKRPLHRILEADMLFALLGPRFSDLWSASRVVLFNRLLLKIVYNCATTVYDHAARVPHSSLQFSPDASPTPVHTPVCFVWLML